MGTATDPPHDRTFRDVYETVLRSVGSLREPSSAPSQNFRPIADQGAAQVAYDRLDAAVQAQAAAADAIDAKLGLFASVGTGVMGTLLAVLALRSSGVGPAEVGLIWTVLDFVALLAAAAYGLLPTRWSYGPRPDVVTYLAQDGYSSDALRNGVIRSLGAAFEFNEVGLRAKVRSLRATYALLGLEVVGLVVALAPLASSGSAPPHP